MRKLKNYKPTRFMAEGSYYDKDAADHAVCFIEKFCCHTKGTWDGKPFELIDWQEQIIRDIFGVLKPNGYRQFNTAYIEIPKKQGNRNWRRQWRCIFCVLTLSRVQKCTAVLRIKTRHELYLSCFGNGKRVHCLKIR